jgi:hypothetical protein
LIQQSGYLSRHRDHHTSSGRRQSADLGWTPDIRTGTADLWERRRRIFRRQCDRREWTRAQGYAAGATDTGHDGSSGSFALGPDGKHNWQVIRDNGHLGIHEMTVTGKALTEAMYGRRAAIFVLQWMFDRRSSGTDGSPALSSGLQRHHVGLSPINWQKLHPQQMWGAMIMNVEGNAMPQCKIAAATAAVVAACDAIDGVKDGVIEDPKRCTYDPKALVGTSAGECGAFTQSDADLIRKFWDGPRRTDGSFLWYGLPRGADLTALWTSRGTPPQVQAFGISLEWFRYFLTQNAQFDWKTLTPICTNVCLTSRLKNSDLSSEPITPISPSFAIVAARRLCGTAGPIN